MELNEIENLTAPLIHNKHTTPTMTVLPKNTIYFNESSRRSVCIVEVPPHHRTIIIDEDKFRLKIPFSIVVIGKNPCHVDLKIFARTTPINKINDKLYMHPLPNIDPHTGQVCVDLPNGLSLSEYHDLFWQTKFSSDIPLLYSKEDEYFFDYFKRWELNSLNNELGFKLKLSPVGTLSYCFLSNTRIDEIKRKIMQDHYKAVDTSRTKGS